MKKITKGDLAGFGDDTKLVVAGRDPSAFHGFVNTPVYHGSTVLAPSVEDLMGRRQRYTYGRRGSPTSEGFEEALKAIEGGVGVVLCPSGLSAVSTALLAVLSAGDHLLMTDSAYGPTRHFCDGPLRRFGVETTYYDPRIGDGIASLVRDGTRAIYMESPGSLTIEVQDVPAIVAVARSRGILTILDNTWATPLLFRPHEHGVDLSLMAGTKYVVGHSDAMFGTVSALPSAWARLKAFHGDSGLCVGPDDIFLAARGLRTMGVRLRQHGASALSIAQWLETRPEVVRVLHPALERDPGHGVWKRDFRGASGLFSAILQPAPDFAVSAFLDDLKLFGLGFSWGGFESLAIPFDVRTSRTATRWEPEGPAIRFHIGLESPADLIADLEEGLARFAAAR
jgi:cystathionine beta-lyase